MNLIVSVFIDSKLKKMFENLPQYSVHLSRAVGTERAIPPPPDFVRSVNPSPTCQGGTDYAQYNITKSPPPDLRHSYPAEYVVGM